MNIRNEIKAIIVREGMTMTEVVEKMADQYGWSASVPNLSGKLQRNSLRYHEAVELADALGYGSCWIQVRMRDAAEGGSSEDYVRSLVKVPEGFRVEAILSIGIPDKEMPQDDAARQAKRAGFAAEKVQYQ